jgi:hypothetical protein
MCLHGRGTENRKFSASQSGSVSARESPKTAHQFIPFLNELKKCAEKLLCLFVVLRLSLHSCVCDGVMENDAARIDQRKATAKTSDVVRGTDVECKVKV